MIGWRKIDDDLAQVINLEGSSDRKMLASMELIRSHSLTRRTTMVGYFFPHVVGLSAVNYLSTNLGFYAQCFNCQKIGSNTI